MKRKRQRYNVVRVRSNFGRVEAILLVRGGDYTNLLTKPAIKTNFYIRLIRVINSETEVDFKMETNCHGDSVLCIYTAESNMQLSVISGYVYTENTEQFYNYHDAKLFFELC